MSNNGVSYRFLIDGTKLKQNKYGQVQRYSLDAVNPPALQQGDKISTSLLKWVNPYPQISFQKIILPYFDGVYKYTTQVSNDPDFIKDYFFIALMRCIDLYNKDVYNAVINSIYDSPSFVRGG